MSWTNVEWAHGETIADFATRMNQMHMNNRWLREDASEFVNIMSMPQEVMVSKTFNDVSGSTAYGKAAFLFGAWQAQYYQTSSTVWVSRIYDIPIPSAYTDPFIPCMCRIKFSVRHPDTFIYGECNTNENRPIWYWPFNATVNRVRWSFEFKISSSYSGDDLTVNVHVRNMVARCRYYGSAFASGFDISAFGE